MSRQPAQIHRNSRRGRPPVPEPAPLPKRTALQCPHCRARNMVLTSDALYAAQLQCSNCGKRLA